MPDWLYSILQIILFIVCLSTLVLIHEAGHLAAAKIFKVYCADFSIGFGKAFLHKKRKKGETYFSLRIIPFGGYVAMAGEEGELEGIDVPKERTINGIKKWKAAIIMSAGILMNLVASILLLYISNQCFITPILSIDAFDVEKDSIAEKAGITSFNYDTMSGNIFSVYSSSKNGVAYYIYSFDSFVTFEDETTLNVVGVVNDSDVSLVDLTFDQSIKYYTYNLTDKVDSSDLIEVDINFDNMVSASSINSNQSPVKNLTLNLHSIAAGNDNDFYCLGCGENLTSDEIVFNDAGHMYHSHCPHPLLCDGTSLVRKNVKNNGKYSLILNVEKDENGNKTFQNSGLKFDLHEYWQSFTQAWTNTFKQFANGSGLIFKTLGGLFIGQGWNNVGSVVSIYTSSKNVISITGKYAPTYLTYYWGIISVNLAIFNLLPFPGLDGWQLLVLAIEGITRKKIPDKVKVIVSYIGLALLFGLMIVLLIKDVIGLF